jgi:hypothetical protein
LDSHGAVIEFREQAGAAEGRLAAGGAEATALGGGELPNGRIAAT